MIPVRLLLVVAIALVLAMGAAGWLVLVPRWPSPTGPHAVGRIDLDVRDPQGRSVAITVWYPAAGPGAATQPVANAPIEAGRPAYLSLVPTQLHRALESAEETAALRTLRTVLLGGGPIDPGLRARAAEAGLTVVATYGSAETAGGCVYDGLALDGVGLATEPDGRLRVSGPMLFDRYDADPGLTARVLVDGWFRTEDAARIDADGRLQVLGRLDDMVVTGGVNVPAPAVALRLRDHPGVREVEVLGVPDEEWGTRLVAFVVGGLSLDEARAWVAEVHPRSWAPRQLVLVHALPLLANGKVDRVQLASAAASS